MDDLIWGSPLISLFLHYVLFDTIKTSQNTLVWYILCIILPALISFSVLLRFFETHKETLDFIVTFEITGTFISYVLSLVFFICTGEISSFIDLCILAVFYGVFIPFLMVLYACLGCLVARLIDNH